MLAVALPACAGGNVKTDSPGYMQGFGDGCGTATARGQPGQAKDLRNAALYESDADYRAGYTSGFATCRMGPPGL
jgi:hypothetical protein